uniref:Uncharacterized protein n=1 Tax=viral metagenome TaxID=1070528 RepID=A0A6C0DXC9_9ZZZZ
MTRYRKLAKKRRTRYKKSKNRRNTRKGGGLSYKDLSDKGLSDKGLFDKIRRMMTRRAKIVPIDEERKAERERNFQTDEERARANAELRRVVAEAAASELEDDLDDDNDQ